MSDQKKWFKVWASIINDSKFQNMRWEDIGRWTILGALMCQQGENGKLKITPPAPILLAIFRVPSLEALKDAFKYLPNVQLSPPLDGHGTFIVHMKYWYKYQVDTTHAVRKTRARDKKRGEEKRSYTSTSTSTPRATRSDSLAESGATRETATATPNGQEMMSAEDWAKIKATIKPKKEQII